MSSALHVYHRLILSDERDSLSVIAEKISPNSTVLDLGMGAGALGKHLAQLSECIVDGVTINADEALLAKPYYRRVAVADLDQINLSEFFETTYDFVVCADVLEHLKNPENILKSIRNILKSDGKLITSIPNAGYCGLCAELIAGDFRYRPEGLLDHTHLRFFTRLSLDRFFHENDWHCIQSTKILRTLDASEFKIHFDALPPTVAQYLLAIPDALTYQFVSVLAPGAAVSQLTPNTLTQPLPLEPVHAYFSAAVYLADAGCYSESSKVVQKGIIGQPSQRISFKIPPANDGYTKIRLDPADRTGFLRIYALQLKSHDGSTLWAWNCTEGPEQLFFSATHQFFIIQPGSASVGILALLLGDDPWIELPIDEQVLATLSRTGGVLELEAGWPMSADYLEAAHTFNAREAEHLRALNTARMNQAEATQQNTLLREELTRLHSLMSDETQRLQLQSLALEQSLDASRAFAQRILAELRLTGANAHQYFLPHTHSTTAPSAGTHPFAEGSDLPSGALTSPDGSNIQSISMAAHEHQPATAPAAPNHPVDIVVPVYRGLHDTKRCLESVLRSVNATPWRLVVINDQSPEDELTAWLQALVATDARILLLENSVNLGFVGTVNRGMQQDDHNDVILLNSDTEVANNWLDRLQAAAYSQAHVASVTPFSNNATICSYPRFCLGNNLPDGFDTGTLDALFARTLTGKTVEIPTAVGFCMYIRRDCLNKVGLFDVENFGKGYGEENDFCMRAISAGWVNLHALDVFVLHTGGISFGASKSARELAAMETMRRLHPHYEKVVHQFVSLDPAAPARLDMDIARIVDSERPVVLNVSHNRDGGTLRHIRELTAQLGTYATFLRLVPVQGGVQLSFEDPNEAFSLRFSMPKDHNNLRNLLQLLRVGHIHYHHLLGHAPEIATLARDLGVSYDFTAHDYYSYCPQITLTNYTDRYCGEQGIDQCRQCVIRNPAPHEESIDSWRDRHSELLSRARFVIAPSKDVAARILRFVPAAQLRTAPHASIEGQAIYPTPVPSALAATTRIKVVVIGALSKIKGADVLEEVALLAAQQNAPIDFHLVGYAYRSLAHQPKARLTVHGSYDEPDLPALLGWLQPDIIWFPAQCPETYSYTLSAALESGYPIVAPNLGAFSERLHGRAWTWVCDWNQSAPIWVEFFSKIRIQNFVEAIEPPPYNHMKGAYEFLPLDYRTNYLAALPVPRQTDAEQRQELRRLISLAAQNSALLSGGPSKLKARLLRLLIILRASPVFSFMAKHISATTQRRVKSWLVR